jgi:hypothetical protein
MHCYGKNQTKGKELGHAHGDFWNSLGVMGPLCGFGKI